MSEGREQLQQAIEAWQKRHAAAVLAQREADIVLPFLRAAVEELDAFRKNGEQAEAVAVAPAIEPVTAPRLEPVAAERKATFSAHQPVVEPEPVELLETTSPFRGKNDEQVANGSGLAAAIGSDDAGADESDESISSAFGRKSIASLIQEAENKEEAAS